MLNILEAEFVLSPEVVEDVGDIGFEGLCVPAFQLHPGMFDLVPEPFDAVEFRAVGRQKQGYRMKKFFIKNKNLSALSQGTSHNKAIKGAGQNLP